MVGEPIRFNCLDPEAVRLPPHAALPSMGCAAYQAVERSVRVHPLLLFRHSNNPGRIGPIAIRTAFPGYQPQEFETWAEPLDANGSAPGVNLALMRTAEGFGKLDLKIPRLPESGAYNEQSLGRVHLEDSEGNRLVLEVPQAAAHEGIFSASAIPFGRCRAAFVTDHGFTRFPHGEEPVTRSGLSIFRRRTRRWNWTFFQETRQICGCTSSTATVRSMEVFSTPPSCTSWQTGAGSERTRLWFSFPLACSRSGHTFPTAGALRTRPTRPVHRPLPDSGSRRPHLLRGACRAGTERRNARSPPLR